MVDDVPGETRGPFLHRLFEERLCAFEEVAPLCFADHKFFQLSLADQAKKLEPYINPVLEQTGAPTTFLKNWTLFGDVYLNFLKEKFAALPSTESGNFLKQFEQNCLPPKTNAQGFGAHWANEICRVCFDQRPRQLHGSTWTDDKSGKQTSFTGGVIKTWMQTLKEKTYTNKTEAEKMGKLAQIEGELFNIVLPRFLEDGIVAGGKGCNLVRSEMLIKAAEVLGGVRGSAAVGGGGEGGRLWRRFGAGLCSGTGYVRIVVAVLGCGIFILGKNSFPIVHDHVGCRETRASLFRYVRGLWLALP